MASESWSSCCVCRLFILFFSPRPERLRLTWPFLSSSPCELSFLPEEAVALVSLQPKSSSCRCFGFLCHLLLLLLGVTPLVSTFCGFRPSLLCSAEARLFAPFAAANSLAESTLLPLSGNDDAPLGSWAATTQLPPSLNDHSVPSLPQLREVETPPNHNNKSKVGRNDSMSTATEEGREGENEGQSRLSKASAASLHEEASFFSEEQQQQEQNKHGKRRVGHKEHQEEAIFWQKRSNPAGQQIPANISWHQQKQHKQPQTASTFGNATYLRTPQRGTAQRQRHLGKESLLQQKKSLLAEYKDGSSLITARGTSSIVHQQAVSRHFPARARPVLLSMVMRDAAAVGKQRRMMGQALQQPGSSVEGIQKRDVKVPVQHYYPLSGIHSQGLLTAARKNGASIFGAERGGALLETQDTSGGIGTVLAGAGLSTLLGGLNQFQQGPIAAGPPGSGVPQPFGVPVYPTPGIQPAAGAPGVSAPAAPVLGMPPAPAGNPLVATAAAAPEPESGHNIIPITVGIIAGLLVMCMIGGCIFSKMRRKKRR